MAPLWIMGPSFPTNKPENPKCIYDVRFLKIFHNVLQFLLILKKPFVILKPSSMAALTPWYVTTSSYGEQNPNGFADEGAQSHDSWNLHAIQVTFDFWNT